MLPARAYNACMLIPAGVLLLVAFCALVVRHLCFSTMVCTTKSQDGVYLPTLCSVGIPAGSADTIPRPVLPERLD